MTNRSLPLLALASTGALLLSGCAGSAGSGGSGGSGGGEGFEYGASQEEVDAAIADLDPVTLKYQPPAASQNSVMAPAALGYKDYIEERSGGKIEIEIIWGQAIAGYSEVDDALADGRLDLAYDLPIYNPSDYPSFDAAAKSFSGVPISPMTGEMVMTAVSADIGWDTQSLLDEYEAQGVTPLTPIVSSGGYYAVCADPGSEPDDWKGRQIRVASTSHHGVANALGASPVSMEYVEVFEALQRGTVDCTFAQLLPSAESGILEVAPNISYSTDEASMSSRAVGAELAGSSFANLPLAYQQIIFDAASSAYSGFVGITADGNAESVRQAKEAGGEIAVFDPATEELIKEENARQRQEVVDGGILGDDIDARVNESIETWSSAVEELGYEDGGSFEDMDEWWESSETDFSPMAERVFEETALEHRPS
ncbi:TRAP transporter substrate-binding protein DctP [Brevibacterium ihuae]|uniref:TRAP transporter substrate-binding protein DctP n=1 Tax=Brevibacterium ihuae TaxID=1631743 RepID=UPI000C774F8A|nr:TRAP transporter substrate-binding protein DctP [Brevibacterium ihuae]